MYEKYESPLSSRYASEEMLYLFSQKKRMQVWRRLWTALARAEHDLGLPITAEQVAELEARLAAVTGERDALHAQLEQMQAAEAVQEPRPEMDGGSQVADELDSYRRAQQVERSARERAELVYHQANGVLNEAIAKVDTATAEITAKTDEAMSQLTQLQMAVSTSKQALQDAASLMNTIRPNY